MGLEFLCDPASGDGPGNESAPAAQVLAHARYKAAEVLQRHPDARVLAADTLVAIGSETLGKARNRADAADMLQRLVAAGTHQVWTGAVLLTGEGIAERADVAQVRFRPIPEEAMARYLNGQEWVDKAGAYALQGWAGNYASLTSGWRGTVVGLDEEAVRALHQTLGLPIDAING